MCTLRVYFVCAQASSYQMSSPIQINRTTGPSDYWALGLSGPRTIGPSDYRAPGLSDPRTIGPPDNRTLGLMGPRTIGPSDHRARTGKNPLKNIFPGTTRQILMKLCMKHQRPKPFIICANYDPGLTLTYFTARSNFAT